MLQQRIALSTAAAMPAIALAPMELSAADRAAGARVLEQLVCAMRSHRFGVDKTPRMDLGRLSAGASEALKQWLGQGEVSAMVRDGDAASAWRVQETAFAGLWRVQRLPGEFPEERLEAGDMPEVVKAALARLPSAAQLDAGCLPKGVMNAPALLNEIRYRARSGCRQAHVLNLSLFPLNAADRKGLALLLGEGPVAMLSRGFGNCKIISAAVRGVWRVQYFNSMNTLILDTIEVIDLPEAARAAAEDYCDSLERLEQLRGWLRLDIGHA